MVMGPERAGKSQQQFTGLSCILVSQTCGRVAVVARRLVVAGKFRLAGCGHGGRGIFFVGSCNQAAPNEGCTDKNRWQDIPDQLRKCQLLKNDSIKRNYLNMEDITTKIVYVNKDHIFYKLFL
jgi:hypothetical protein